MKQAAFFLTGCLALMSCAPVYKTVVEKDYESQKIHDATLIIAPPVNMTIDYFGNVKDEFGEGDPQKLILKHFKEAVLKKLVEYSTFSSVAFDTFAMRPSFHQVKFEMGDAFGLTIDLPGDTATIPFATMTPDFVLFLQDLAIGTESINDGSAYGNNETDQSPESGYCSYSRQAAAGSFAFQTGAMNYGPPPMSSPMPQMFFYPSTPKSKYLRYKCGFAFWDNRKHRVAAYGKIFSKSKADSYGLGVVQIIRIANWQEIDDRFVQSILWGTPFRR
jgi:hypothetical protein